MSASGDLTVELGDKIKAAIAADQAEQRRILELEQAGHPQTAPKPREEPAWAIPPAPPLYAAGALGRQIRRKRLEAIVRKAMDAMTDELEDFPEGEEKAHYIRVRFMLNDVIGECKKLQKEYPLERRRLNREE